MTYELDEKDLKIIEILKEHGNFTSRQIAKKTLLPVTTIYNRIKKLKKEKIIKKFTVELEQTKLEKGFVAYVLISVDLELLKQKKKTQYELAKELKKLPFIERADIVSGGADIVTIIRVKDVREYDKTLLGKIQPIEGIKHTQSLIVIHEE